MAGISYIHPVAALPGFPWGRYPSGGYHPALDYPVREGTPVWAPAAGRIVVIGWDDTGYGNHIRILHANGHVSILGHLSSFAVEAWDYVAQGQVVAGSGNTGRSSGPHLHWETRTNLLGLQRFTAYNMTPYIGTGRGLPADPGAIPGDVWGPGPGEFLKPAPSSLGGQVEEIGVHFVAPKRAA